MTTTTNTIETNEFQKELYILSRGNRKFSLMIREYTGEKETRNDFVCTGTRKSCINQKNLLQNNTSFK